MNCNLENEKLTKGQRMGNELKDKLELTKVVWIINYGSHRF